MEDFFTLQLRTIYVESSKIRTGSIFPPQFDINFRFSFQTINADWVVQEDTGLWRLHGRHVSAMTEKLVSLNVKQFLDYKETCENLHELLEDWPVLDSSRETMVDFVWRRTGREIKNIHARCNASSVSLHFHIATVNTNILDEGGLLDEVGSDDDDLVMVPAAESSIDLLETKMTEDGGSCPICMDDLCEGLCMPCLHLFHGDCIKNWLKISHYCPLCRLVMPIAI